MPFRNPTLDPNEVNRIHDALFNVQPQAQKLFRINPNEREAFNIPMSRLVSIWEVKFGDRWVDGNNPYRDNPPNFFSDALLRLTNANMMESFDGWHRLKERLA